MRANSAGSHRTNDNIYLPPSHSSCRPSPRPMGTKCGVLFLLYDKLCSPAPPPARRHRSYQRLFIGWKNEFRAQPAENEREKRAARFSHADTYRASLTTSEADTRAAPPIPTGRAGKLRGCFTHVFSFCSRRSATRRTRQIIPVCAFVRRACGDPIDFGRLPISHAE